MKLSIAFLSLLFISSTAFAEAQCLLEGAGSFELSCENKDLSIRIELSGDSGTSLRMNNVASADSRYVPEPEKDLTLVSFERLEEGVFAAQLHKFTDDRKIVNPYLALMAVPSSVKMDQAKRLVQPQGAREGSGTFTGRLEGLFDLNAKDYEKTRVNTKVSCSFNFVRCPR